MIGKDSFSVYAQYNEDVILAALLYKVEKGFYVDVGANYPDYHSVTKYFYDRGWSGINIEPIPELISKLKKQRKRDINLQLAVSQEKGKLKFREYPGNEGLSTLSNETKSEISKSNLSHKDYEVRSDSLKNILDQYKTKKIDFLKVDVEGYEYEVLKSNNWDKYRPTVICIEANHRLENWSKFLTEEEYQKVIADGLNEYYVAKESIEITVGFAERATLLAHNAIRRHHVDAWDLETKRIKFLEDFTNKQDELIRSTQNALKKSQEVVEETSFKDKTFKRRLALALKSLTIDYYHYRSRR